MASLLRGEPVAEKRPQENQGKVRSIAEKGSHSHFGNSTGRQQGETTLPMNGEQ